VWCWGGDALGQTGGNGHVQCNPNQTCDPMPVQVELPGTLMALSAGHDSTCVPLPLGATALTVGTSHACAILTDASVWCWGTNRFGELGDGTFDTSSHGPAHVSVCE
jgi:alpha-tubulin suppressor-like RCC1 family protein